MTTRLSTMITSISASDVAKITSGQVIIDVTLAVKEIVENSLDAGSDKIDITFNNYGIQSVEVSDNGHGIDPSDFEALCLRHHTSKLQTFDDLTAVRTLGFRGEAMSALCSVSKVKISTCTKESFPKATELNFDSMGRILARKTMVSGKKGTTVTVSDLFHGMPVRQKTLAKNGKKEYFKAVQLLTGYLLAYPGVRFTIFNISGSTGKKSMTMGTQGDKSTIPDTLVSLFGSNGAYGLVPLDLDSGNIEARFKLNLQSVPMSLRVHAVGYISDSSFGLGRGSSDRQFLTINRRPVTHKKITKVINEVYKTFNTLQSPVFVIDLEVDTAFLDVNVTPDKRMVMIQSEDVVAEALREKLTEFYEPRNNVVPMNQVVKMGGGDRIQVKEENQRLGNRKIAEMSKTKTNENSDRSQSDDGRSVRNRTNSKVTISGTTSGPKDSGSEISENEEESAQNDCNHNGHRERGNNGSRTGELDQEDSVTVEYAVAEVNDEFDSEEGNISSQVEEESQDEDEHKSEDQDRGGPNDSLNEGQYGEKLRRIKESPAVLLPATHSHTEDTGYLSSHDNAPEHTCTVDATTHPSIEATATPATPASVKGAYDDDFADLQDTIDLFVDPVTPKTLQVPGILPVHRMRMKIKVPKMNVEKVKPTSGTTCVLAALHDLAQSLEIHKSDFTSMEVVGQFNLGFIVVTHQGKLFIVDQHALDEIYNYEVLMRTLELRAQPLVVPRQLELLPIDEMIVLEHRQQLRTNGFVVTEDADAPPGRRAVLQAVPVLRNIVFDDADLHEIVHKLHSSTGNAVRCTKVDSMIALRACRRSIMVGLALSTSTMRRVVQHLAELERPWNCPHGRPTMRHLADMEGSVFVHDYEV